MKYPYVPTKIYRSLKKLRNLEELKFHYGEVFKFNAEKMRFLYLMNWDEDPQLADSLAASVAACANLECLDVNFFVDFSRFPKLRYLGVTINSDIKGVGFVHGDRE